MFGKTDGASTGDDTPSISSADEYSATKEEAKEEAKAPAADAAAGAAMGPAPPQEDDYDPEEIKKAEEFKT